MRSPTRCELVLTRSGKASRAFTLRSPRDPEASTSAPYLLDRWYRSPAPTSGPMSRGIELKLSTKTRAIPLTMALAGSVALTACGASNESSASGASDSAGSSAEQLSGTLNGAGSSAQTAAMQGWTVGYNATRPDVTINYDPVGSGGGRDQFVAGGVDLPRARAAA